MLARRLAHILLRLGIALKRMRGLASPIGEIMPSMVAMRKGRRWNKSFWDRGMP